MLDTTSTSDYELVGRSRLFGSSFRFRGGDDISTLYSLETQLRREAPLSAVRRIWVNTGGGGALHTPPPSTLSPPACLRPRFGNFIPPPLDLCFLFATFRACHQSIFRRRRVFVGFKNYPGGWLEIVLSFPVFFLLKYRSRTRACKFT